MRTMLLLALCLTACNGDVEEKEDCTFDRFEDLDGDGFGGAAFVGCASDGIAQGGDCDDQDPERNPNAVEVCDGIDNDCDGASDDLDANIDPASQIEVFVDADADGWGQALPTLACGLGPGLASQAGDCDDSDPDRHPDAIEVCDELDNDCDGLADEADDSLQGAPAAWADADGDGTGDPSQPVVWCEVLPNTASNDTDCDDTLASRAPGNPEICDGLDNDCDNLVDEQDDSLQGGLTAWFDSDGDGAGDPASPVITCIPRPGIVLNDRDCDDTWASAAPGNPEICDGIDNDCDGSTDDADPNLLLITRTGWHEDLDGDGFGNPLSGVLACAPPASHVADGSDCDDEDPDAYPGAAEVCDGIDNDCDRITDDADPDLVGGVEVMADDDGDGFGVLGLSAFVCEPPLDLVLEGDCDDEDAASYPGAPEICDKADNDCDGLIDDDDGDVDLSTGRIFYVDDDDDGYGVDTLTITQCWIPVGYTPQLGDCDDTDRSLHPLAYEICDGIDNNCSGLVDDDDPALAAWINGSTGYFADLDGDGYGDPAAPWNQCGAPGPGFVDNADDCDDTNSSVFVRGDADGDGFFACDPNPTLADCDDSDGNVFPGQVELCNDVDDDCDGHPDVMTGGGDTVALGCDLCPEASTYNPSANIVTETYNPCVLDPAAQNLCADGVSYVDTHDDGQRLHKVIYRTDLTSWRDELFLFFPPGKGQNNRNITQWAAHVGYKVINLGYDNEAKLSDLCAGLPSPCYGPIREETHYGTDATAALDIGPADSVEGRLGTLLAHLDATYPGMGWSNHIDTDGTPRWATIIPVGWSNGSGTAAYAARESRVPAAVMIGGPTEPSDNGQVAAWITDEVWATPSCALNGLYHTEEIHPYGLETWQQAWLAMGIDNTVEIDLDTEPYPTWHPAAQNHHTTTFFMGADHCTPHKATAFDQCMDTAALVAPYMHFFCELPLDATCDQ